MRVLVTGGAGYVGSVVSRTLLAHGHDVVVLDALLYGGRSLLGCYGDEHFRFVRGDIRSVAVVKEALAGVDAVVHLAAIVGDPACARQPVLAREVNLNASLQLIELAQSQGVQRFVFASTCSNYGRMSAASESVTEESELRPISLYAETKVAVERALLERTAPGLTSIVLRFATVFGLSPRPRFDLTVNEFTAEMLTKRKIIIYGAEFWRPYVHVRDAARAVGLVLDAPADRVEGRAFNVGDSSQNYRKGELAELIRSHVGDDVDIEEVPKAEDPRDYRVSFEKIKRELGFSITRTVEAGIREIVDAINQGVVVDLDAPCHRN